MAVKNVVVVGGGTMGNGITHVFAQSGYETMLIDIKQEYVDRAISTIKKNLDRQAQKGTIKPEDVVATIGRITTSTLIDDACTGDIVIEAAFENMDVKTEIFKKLDAVCKPDAILASNTSALPITQIAAKTKRP
ncbi:MAG TPA: 3-hydroxybutyryl-CoA dehydrogenase, partial [candidate division Zixibacteria bacterium]|nr:3-hydroxybutyryl-CoA dehydrogenase [candidate division Zixibacteria bacterium]